MPTRLQQYFIAPNVEFQVLPIEMKYTNWLNALDHILTFFEDWAPRQLVFTVHDSTRSIIARGLVADH